jgi:hypothetical protein
MVGGIVDGLAGSGLELADQGAQLNVAVNGSFRFPGTFPAGSPYDVRVQAQPTNPDQVCGVVDGTGTVTADVSSVAVHCTNVATPTGLDTSFGAGGRVSTRGGGDARAVVVEPDGRIIVVGRRDVGVNAHFQFGATGYDATGTSTHASAPTGLRRPVSAARTIRHSTPPMTIAAGSWRSVVPTRPGSPIPTSGWRAIPPKASRIRPSRPAVS